MGSSVGSAILVVSMVIRQPSVGIVVKHHAPTDACPTSRLHQDKKSNKKINKKSSFSPFRML